MKYHFHARASGIPLFMTEGMFHSLGYGMFDYFFLQEKSLISGYFSDLGLQQVHEYAVNNLFDSGKRANIIRGIQDYDEKLHAFSLSEDYWSTHSDVRDRLEVIALMRELVKEFGNQYFIMEQPWLLAVEEVVQAACDREGLSHEEVLRDSKIITNFSKKEEELLGVLVELGHLKLSVHTHAEPLMQSIYGVLEYISLKEGIPMEIAQSMTGDDIEEYFRTGAVSRDILELRSRGVILFPVGMGTSSKMGVGKEYEKWSTILESRFNQENSSQLAAG